MSRLVVALGLLAALSDCSHPSDASGPDLRMRVHWDLRDPAATLPTEVDQLQVEIFVGGESEPISFIRSVAGLMDEDDNGRREIVAPCDPRIGPCEGLPVGTDIRLTVTGLVGGAPRYVGHAGPFVLQPGERRYVDLFMFRIGESTTVDRTPIRGRFLHTASPLPDGRVLIAGGFDQMTRMPACPAEVPTEARCFRARASREAFVFDPTSARFYQVRGGMIEARAGHTASVLPSGAVLLAGGATEAVFAFVPQGFGGPVTGYGLAVFPRDEAGVATALATFEIFDPEANPEEEDVDADGDPGRGGFVGAADDEQAPYAPGQLDVPRFMAAAALLPGSGRVLIAGGLDPSAAATYALFDVERPGGWGVIGGGPSPLAVPRWAPGAAAVGSAMGAQVWIVGGLAARSNADLAEVWSPTGASPLGASTSASTAPLEFPQRMAGGTEERPEWSFLRPIVHAVGTGHVVVIGWYGPRCAMDGTVVFEGAAPATEYCGFSPARSRAFTVDVRTGLAQSTMLNSAHAFGSSAVLDDGRIVVTGGLSSIVWETSQAIDLLTGDVTGGIAEVAPAPGVMRVARAFHATAPLPHGGFLTTGGIDPDASVSSVTLVGSSEVLYLQP